MIEKMKSLLRRKSSCVLATTDGDTPHCSLTAYITSEAADRLYLVTRRDTKKYRNIKHHQCVNLLIDTRGEPTRRNIGRTKRDYVWNMARDPSIVSDDCNRTLQFLKSQGYDIAKIQKVTQKQNSK